MNGRLQIATFALLAICSGALCCQTAALAEEGVWRVSRASGEVSVAARGLQPAALTQDAPLKAGDTIRTGQTGRVLLVRGQETILVGPNASIGLPASRPGSGSTVIIQQSGTILLEVEKKNAPHFEVLTPFLAAVVKGTQFRVSVDGHSSKVDVLRGVVDVGDHRSGQHAMVTPGQSAEVSTRGPAGLSLSGTGAAGVVVQGRPVVRATSLPVAETAPPAPTFSASESQAAATAGGNGHSDATTAAAIVPAPGASQVAGPAGSTSTATSTNTNTIAAAAAATAKSTPASSEQSGAGNHGNGGATATGGRNAQGGFGGSNGRKGGGTDGNSNSGSGSGSGKSGGSGGEKK